MDSDKVDRQCGNVVKGLTRLTALTNDLIHKHHALMQYQDQDEEEEEDGNEEAALWHATVEGVEGLLKGLVRQSSGVEAAKKWTVLHEKLEEGEDLDDDDDVFDQVIDVLDDLLESVVGHVE